MTAKKLIKAYGDLSAADQATVLSMLIHSVSIIAREAYIDLINSSDQIERLKRCNELIHKISGQLIAGLVDSGRMADEDFLRACLSSAIQGGFGDTFTSEIDRAIDFVGNRSASTNS